MRRNRLLLWGVAAWIAAAGALPVPVLQIAAVAKGEVVFSTFVGKHERFSLSFVHSVERSPVQDFFLIDEAYRLTLVETLFQSSNAGLPYAPSGEERFQRTPEGFRLTNMHRVLPAIELWVHEAYDNTLRIAGREVRLPSLAGNALLRLSIERVPLAAHLLRGWRM